MKARAFWYPPMYSHVETRHSMAKETIYALNLLLCADGGFGRREGATTSNFLGVLLGFLRALSKKASVFGSLFASENSTLLLGCHQATLAL